MVFGLMCFNAYCILTLKYIICTTPAPPQIVIPVSEMSLAVIESILESTDMGEVLRPFQDITYLLTVFFSVFLANLGIETVKSIIGRQIINLKQCYSLLSLF